MEYARVFTGICFIFIAFVEPVWPGTTCVGTGSACKTNADCCGSANFATILCAKNKFVAAPCVGTGSACKKNSDCCSSDKFATILCAKKKCIAAPCLGTGSACKKDTDCCSSNLPGIKCSKNKCVAGGG